MFQYQHVRCKECQEIINKNDGHNCDSGIEELKVIASWGICNTASLNVFLIEDDQMLVAINDEKPQWCGIDSFLDEDWQDKGLEDEWNQGIDFNGLVYFIDECVRV